MIRVEKGDDSVALLTLDRPAAKNALTVEMRDDLVEGMAAFREKRDPKFTGR